MSPGSTAPKPSGFVSCAHRRRFAPARRPLAAEQAVAWGALLRWAPVCTGGSRLSGVSHSGVFHALDWFAIPPHVNGHQRTGPLPFGLDYQDHKLVMNGAEQAATRMMQERRISRLSLPEMAGKLNAMLMPTKQGDVWQANTVEVILALA